jgi:hypothetical protein
VSAVSRAVLALALSAAPLAAQAPGLPVHGGGFRHGPEVIGTVGWSGFESQAGDATTFAGTFAYGWSRVGLAGTFGLVSGTLSQATAGVLVGVRLLGDGVQSPFEVGAFGGAVMLFGGSCADEGAGTSAGPCDEAGDWRIPLGASIAVAITTPYVSIRPWLAPRVEIFEALDVEETATKFAGSAGVDFRFAGGFGLRLLWEKVESQDQTLGVGLSYRF